MSVKVTLDQIRARATDQSFSRGQNYFKNDAIFDTVQRGNELHGYCEASSQPEPYHVRVTLGDKGVVEAMCTCPYEFGGDCKHIVALLLTYVDNPGKFDKRPPVAELLASRDKEALIALIRKMIDRYPDLEALVDLPVPGKTKRDTPVDTTAFRKQMRYALRNYGGWGDRTAESTINSINATARDFADKGDWRSASAIYRTIVEECSQEDEYPVPEDEGEFSDAFNDTIQRLGECLEQPDLANDDQERRAIFDSLLTASLWDTEIGGYDLGADALGYILQHARQSDLAGLRDKVKAAQGRHSKWAAQEYAEFLIELDTLDSVDPEVILARLREEEMYSLLVRKLLEIKRIDEAVNVVENDIVNPYERMAELPHLVAVGREEDAIRLARQTLQSGYDSHMAGWLMERYKTRGDWEPYLQLQRQEMQAVPTERNYVLLKEAAEKVGQWQAIRSEILAWLKKNQRFDVIIRAYLHDEEWDAAWETLDKARATNDAKNAWLYLNLDLDIAQQSRKARPERAIPVYIKYARWHISQRDRKHYQDAAAFLFTVRELYLQLDDLPTWQKLISGIRAEFPSLRALQDELNKAGL